MYNANIKTEIINNIIFEMSGYVDYTTLDIMQKVIEKQLVAVNMEEITNLRQKSGHQRRNKTVIISRL